MPVTDAQVRKMFQELQKDKNLSRAAMKAGMDRKTARRYRDAQQLPSQMNKPRTWRTRKDPFNLHWQPLILPILVAAPEIMAKVLFEHLLQLHPDHYHNGQLRTFQRRIRQWRAMDGPHKQVFFPQMHRPGEALQTDFTWCTALNITLAGEPFDHMLCHCVLPYSNWQSVAVCRSESLAAIKNGLQHALFRLDRKPEFHQTDNSTAATHKLGSGERGFNDDYLTLMGHFGLTPRTIAIRQSNQNGDVEALHGVLKRRLEAYLLLRGSRDFDTQADYQRWLDAITDKANASRQDKVDEECAVMPVLAVQPLPAFTELKAPVTSWSTIRVKYNTYSVPSRLIGETVRVRLYEDQLDVFFGGAHQLTCERLLGRYHSSIDYRHLIWSLVHKPGAFARYRFREDLFPTLSFRRAYDALLAHYSVQRTADHTYLRLLHLAASTMEVEVEVALELLLEAKVVPTLERVQGLLESQTPEVPDLAVPEVDLAAYDALLPAQCLGVG